MGNIILNVVKGAEDSAPSTLPAQRTQHSAPSHALQTPGFFIKSPGLGRSQAQTDTRGKGKNPQAPALPACPGLSPPSGLNVIEIGKIIKNEGRSLKN